MENLEPREAEKIVELNKDYRDKKYAWLRYLILLSSGSISILISLKKTSEHNCIFSSTLILLGLGILSGAIALYGEVKLSERMLNNLQIYLNKPQKDKADEALLATSMPKHFFFFEKACYLSLALSLVFLILYAIL